MAAVLQFAGTHSSHLRVWSSLCWSNDRTLTGPRLWNSLPISLRQISSFGQFRRHLKSHLFGIWEITAQCDAWFSALYKYSYLLTYLYKLCINHCRINVWKHYLVTVLSELGTVYCQALLLLSHYCRSEILLVMSTSVYIPNTDHCFFLIFVFSF